MTEKTKSVIILYVEILLVVIAVFLAITIIFFLSSYICYLIVFKTTKKQKKYEDFSLPKGKIYLKYKDQMLSFMKEARQIPFEAFEIKSFDGLTLRGKFYEYRKGAPIEIMFHGYRGNSERDLAGGIQRCFTLKRSALVVDQRGHGNSDGFNVYFGAKEKYDVQSWANFVYKKFGDEIPILITGISMGASSVLLATELKLPPTVKGVIADCGYSSAKDIINKVLKQLYLPSFIFYPIIAFGARFYGKFNLNDADVVSALEKSKIPVKFIHGTTDDFVPYSMSKLNYDACMSEKSILLVEGAGHGLSYLVNKQKYLEEVKFF